MPCPVVVMHHADAFCKTQKASRFLPDHHDHFGQCGLSYCYRRSNRAAIGLAYNPSSDNNSFLISANWSSAKMSYSPTLLSR